MTYPGETDIDFHLADIVAGLRSAREIWRKAQHRQDAGGRELPSREALDGFVRKMRGVLFPMRLGPPELRQEDEDYYIGHTLSEALNSLFTEVRLELRYQARQPGAPALDVDAHARHIVREFGATLPAVRTLLDGDVHAAFVGDPAAHSVDEVLLSYPGIRAMISHRIAHRLYELGVPILARLVAELAHGETGIDIHPGATIDVGFFIDHGTGVVIGETARIGRNVRLYQAVTLGAKRFEADDTGALKKGLPRHPILEDDVVVYAGATILGRVTIGRGSSIGGNVWLTHGVPPGSRVTQANARAEAPVEAARA